MRQRAAKQIEVVTRSNGQLTRLIPLPCGCGRRVYEENLKFEGERCLQCDQLLTAPANTMVRTDETLYRLYGHIRFYKAEAR